MSAAIDFNLQKYDGEFKAAGMARIEKAAKAIQGIAKGFCEAGSITRPVRKRYVYQHHLEPSSGPLWTAREIGGMMRSIRVSRSHDASVPNVRVYAGNFAAWYAIQMEFGRGRWKGGARPFLRPALHTGESVVRSIIEGR